MPAERPASVAEPGGIFGEQMKPTGCSHDPDQLPPPNARLTARALLEIKAVHFNAETPSRWRGLPSPTYIDCRKLISYSRIRATLMDFPMSP